MKLAMICFLCSISSLNQSSAQQGWTRVAQSGMTSVTGSVGGRPLVVDMFARIEQVPPDDKHENVNHATSCTYSVSPCSDIYMMRVFISGKEVFVPRSIFADLADVTNTRIIDGGHNTATLIMRGGENAEGFEIHVRLDKDRILERGVYTVPGVKGGPLEVTRYYTVEFN